MLGEPSVICQTKSCALVGGFLSSLPGLFTLGLSHKPFGFSFEVQLKALLMLFFFFNPATCGQVVG